MTIAYIGFSNLNGVSHMGASNAGVALSDYTYSLLDSVVDTDYYVCQDKVNSRPSSLVFEIRQNKFYATLDSIRFFFKLKHRNEYDFVILYHSFLFLPLLVLLKMFRYKTILQVNEIYSLSGTHSGLLHRLIEKWIFKSTTRFIISTEALKPYLSKGRVHDVEILTVIPGPIAISEEESKSRGVSCGVQKIKLVYTGVVDNIKNGGAFISVELARLLDDSNYLIDIFGFGSDKDVKDLIKLISENNTTSKTIVSFRGNLPPLELVKTIKNYDIGLAAQYIDTSFSLTSFPSKILTYLSAGLQPVCATSPPVNLWEHKHILYVYHKKDLSDLVEYVKSYNKHDHKEVRKLMIEIQKSIRGELLEVLK